MVSRPFPCVTDRARHTERAKQITQPPASGGGSACAYGKRSTHGRWECGSRSGCRYARRAAHRAYPTSGARCGGRGPPVWRTAQDRDNLREDLLTFWHSPLSKWTVPDNIRTALAVSASFECKMEISFAL